LGVRPPTRGSPSSQKRYGIWIAFERRPSTASVVLQLALSDARSARAAGAISSSVRADTANARERAIREA
jgi:hypothetical protein